MPWVQPRASSLRKMDYQRDMSDEKSAAEGVPSQCGCGDALIASKFRVQIHNSILNALYHISI